MSSSKNVVTIGSLIQKCLRKAYFLPQRPTSYSKGYRFSNDKKYRLYDCPPSSMDFYRLLYPFRHVPAAGNEVPIIMECPPPAYLQHHWRRWLPAFPSPVIKPLEEALLDDVPVVTTAAIQSIPDYKQSIHPDLLYKLQLKSSILDIEAPCPRHLDINSVSYPCAVKPDLGMGGRGSWFVTNEDELSDALHQMKDVCNWKDEIVIQEFIPGVKEVPSFQFYLHKSGDLFWLGTTSGGFTGRFSCTSSSVDWDKQEEYEDLVYDEFTLPVKNYLQNQGYFGLVTFEVLITDHAKYLIDVNPRIGGDTTHLLIARHLALDFGLKHSTVYLKNKHDNMTAEMLVKLADNVNGKGEGMIVIISAMEADQGCESYVSIFAKSPEEVQRLFQQLNVTSKVI